MIKDLKKGQIRPSIRLSEEEYKRVAVYCAANGLKVGEYLRLVALNGVDKDIAKKIKV